MLLLWCCLCCTWYVWCLLNLHYVICHAPHLALFYLHYLVPQPVVTKLCNEPPGDWCTCSPDAFTCKYDSLTATPPPLLFAHTRVFFSSSTGAAASMLANRLSFTLGTVGPSMTVDTACSSSLVALRQACLHLRDGEGASSGGRSRTALVGGVNLLLSPGPFDLFSKVICLISSPFTWYVTDDGAHLSNEEEKALLVS